MIIVVSGGMYSDCWEHWYATKVEGMTQEELGRRMLKYEDEAQEIMERRSGQREEEALARFGVLGEEMAKWGGEQVAAQREELEEFRRKWRGMPQYEEVLLGLCGLTRLRAEMEIDVGDRFPCEAEGIRMLAEGLQG